MSLTILMRFLLAAAVLALVGCTTTTKQRALLDTIPASSEYVAGANLDLLLKMAACPSYGGAITLSSDINHLIAKTDTSALALLQSVAELGYCLDLERAYAFHYSGHLIFTAPRKNNVDLRGPVDKMKIVSLGSVETVPLPRGTTLVATHRQGWIASGSPEAVAELIDQAVKAADKSSIASASEVTKLLSGKETLKAYAIIPKDIQNPFGQNATAALLRLDVRDRAIEMQVEFEGEGSSGCPFSELAPIDEGAFFEAPLGAVAYLGIGLGPNTISRLGPLRKRLPFTSQLAVDAVVSLCDPEGGTLSIAAAPGGNAETIKKFNLDNWLVRAWLPMGDKAEDAAKLINKFAPENLHCYALDSALAITSYDIDNYPEEEDLPSPPANARVWVYAQVPYNSPLMRALNLSNGYQLEAYATACEIRTNLRIMGQAQYILPALIRDINANR